MNSEEEIELKRMGFVRVKAMQDLTRFQKKMDEKKLSAREQNVALLLLRGYPYRQCAEELGISIDTVKYHARNVYRNLSVSGRNELFLVYVNDRP